MKISKNSGQTRLNVFFCSRRTRRSEWFVDWPSLSAGHKEFHGALWNDKIHSLRGGQCLHTSINPHSHSVQQRTA